jgi:hypothetical protein
MKIKFKIFKESNVSVLEDRINNFFSQVKTIRILKGNDSLEDVNCELKITPCPDGQVIVSIVVEEEEYDEEYEEEI